MNEEMIPFSPSTVLTRVKMAFLILLSWMLTSCGPHDLRHYQHESEEACSDLLELLRSIETREQLSHSKNRLEKLFQEIADLMISADELVRNNGSVEQLPP